MQVIIIIFFLWGGGGGAGGLLPIGEESGAIFLKQTQSVVIRNNYFSTLN